MNFPADNNVDGHELDQLRRALAEAQLKIESLELGCRSLEEQRQALEEQRRDLEHQVMLLKRCLFGSRSEKISAGELEARIAKDAQEAAGEIAHSKRPDAPPAEAEEEKPEEAPKPKEKSKRRGRPHGRGPFPPHLPRRRIEHPIDPARGTCQHCSDHPPLKQIGEDIREKLHKLPVQYEVHQHVFPICVCERCHGGVEMPESNDNGLKADITVVADVAVQKYAEHKPLYRQQQAFDRVGIHLPRQTLCDWMGWCSDEAEPLVGAMKDYILRHRCVQSDETPVRMQLSDGTMQTARLWAYGLPWAEVVFDFATDKSHEGPEEFLRGAKLQYLQADGGSSYGPVLRHLTLLHIACMAHIRRKIFEAREDAPVACDRLLAAIQQLYRIERRAKDEKLDRDGILELRQREARPLFEDLRELLKLFAAMRPPKTPFGRAIKYADNQWEAMARYLEVPEAELDNNSIYAARGINGVMPTSGLCRVAEMNCGFSA